VPNVQWKTPDDGQRNCPEHVEFLDKNKFGKNSASVGFIKKKFVTMHGYMNVKINKYEVLNTSLIFHQVTACLVSVPTLSVPVRRITRRSKTSFPAGIP
jgi:hypothetical protein